MTNDNNIINPKTVHEIYRKILEYGNTCFHCGITYQHLKDRLICEKYYEEGQAEKQLINLFNYNYSCYHDTCTNPNKKKILDDCGCEDDNYDHLNNCPQYLSKEGCLDLIKLLDSDLNNKSAIANNDAASKNLKISNTTKNLGIGALVISAIGLVLTIYSTYNLLNKPTLETNIEKPNLQKQDKSLNKTVNDLPSKNLIDTYNVSIKHQILKDSL